MTQPLTALVLAVVLWFGLPGDAQLNTAADFGPPSGLQAVYYTPSPALTPLVVLGDTAYVGTASGVFSGVVVDPPAPQLIERNEPTLALRTAYPVTTMWKHNETSLVAVANDTIHHLSSSGSIWNFTLPGYQFDFAATMTGQFPLPAVSDGVMFVGTKSLNDNPQQSFVLALHINNGTVKWSSSISAAYTNYPIQLSQDGRTIVIRATSGVRTTVQLLDAASGNALPFLATTRYASASSWLPVFALFGQSLWVNDYCGYVDVYNITTNASQALQSVSCSLSGRIPVLLNGVVFVATGNSVQSFDATTFSALGSSSSAVGDLQQVVPFGANTWVFCGRHGMQLFAQTNMSFLSTAGEVSPLYFSPKQSSSSATCGGLAWINGLLVANFDAVYAINVSAGVVEWSTSAVHPWGQTFIGPVSVVTTPQGVFYAAAAKLNPFYTEFPTIYSWHRPSSGGWASSALAPSNFGFVGAPFNVLVVQSAANNDVTIVDAFTGDVVATYPEMGVDEDDSTPVQVGDFACSNQGTVKVYCVPLQRQFGAPFNATPAGQSSAYRLTVSGSVLYRTTSGSTIEMLDTSQPVPTFTTLSLPATTTPTAFRGAAVLGSMANGQPALFTSSSYAVMCLNLANPALDWALSTSSLDSIGTAFLNSFFSTNVVQIPGDANHLFVGGAAGNVYGIMKLSASSGSFEAFYSFPSLNYALTAPYLLLAGPNLLIAVQSTNLTACDSAGNLYWTYSAPLDPSSPSSLSVITDAKLDFAAGVVLVLLSGNTAATWLTLNAFTGEVLWSASRGGEVSCLGGATDGLVLMRTGSKAMLATLRTGKLVGTYSTTDYAFRCRSSAVNRSDGVWVFNSGGGSIFALRVAADRLPPPSHRTVAGSLVPIFQPSHVPSSLLWLIAPVGGGCVVLILIAAVVAKLRRSKSRLTSTSSRDVESALVSVQSEGSSHLPRSREASTSATPLRPT